MHHLSQHKNNPCLAKALAVISQAFKQLFLHGYSTPIANVRIVVEFEELQGTESRHVDRRFELGKPSDLTSIPFTLIISVVTFWPITTNEMRFGRLITPTPTG